MSEPKTETGFNLRECHHAFRKWVQDYGADFSLATDGDDEMPDHYYTDSSTADAFDGFLAGYRLGLERSKS